MLDDTGRSKHLLRWPLLVNCQAGLLSGIASGLASCDELAVPWRCLFHGLIGLGWGPGLAVLGLLSFIPATALLAAIEGNSTGEMEARIGGNIDDPRHPILRIYLGWATGVLLIETLFVLLLNVFILAAGFALSLAILWWLLWKWAAFDPAYALVATVSSALGYLWLGPAPLFR